MSSPEQIHAPGSRVIIVGGGFAGLKLARLLDNSSYDILLIDKINHHQFQPLFYQVATAGLEPSSISFPLRGLFQRSRNIRIRLAEVQKVFPERNTIQTSIGEFPYDHLVLATGCDTNFFGNKNFESLALPMKSTSEALYLRYRILQNFENALAVDPVELEALMTYVIVGGGPTGVELAGALAEMKKHVLPRDYHDLDFSKMKIILVEGGGKTLASMSPEASKYSQKYLEEFGVDVRLNTRVNNYDGELLQLEGTLPIKTKTVIWAAGVKGNAVDGINPALVARGNRIQADRFNRVQGYQNIYAVGDIAFMITPKYPNAHPQLANVAISQAKCLGKNLLLTPTQAWKEFEYHDKGSLATVGKHKAVADLPWMKFEGVFAWYAWMGLHLVLLMGFKNKLFVLIDWVISYFSNNSTLRLIFTPIKKRAAERP